VTPSFMHLCITLSNQRFSNCSPTMDVGFVKLKSDRFCGKGLHDDYSNLVSPVLW
jgi:pyrimidine deaminase RibD-like protein